MNTTFLTLLSTPRLVSSLQSALAPLRPSLSVDGFFGPITGQAMGELYLENQLPIEWKSQVPGYEQMRDLQVIVASHYPIDIDGHFGPATGEAIGKLLMNGRYIPRQRTNDEAIALLKELEGNGKPGKPFQAYICPTGVPTIGYGRTIGVTVADVRSGRTITPEEADANLKEDLEFFEDEVHRRLRVSVGSNMFSSMALLAYNIGGGGFGRSTVLRETNSRNYREAAAAFEMWDKGDTDGDGILEVIEGLKRRRQLERELYERDL